MCAANRTFIVNLNRPIAKRSYVFAGAIVVFVAVLWLVGKRSAEVSLLVTATAYNSVADQTEGSPDLGAWGDKLKPGMKAIAVSPDLVEIGLVHGTHVRIEGLPGEYTVLDKMPARWKRKIDIYMGEDVSAARQWGKREVQIRWRPS